MNIALLGSVDHGKSTLIARLLIDSDSVKPDRVRAVEAACKALGRPVEIAYILDALKEERESEMTVDTVHTMFQHDGSRLYTIIDTPGHLGLLSNTLSGATHADAAILVVAVTEGITAQTLRHYNLLGLLGIDQIIVVVNKMDLVGYDYLEFFNLRSEICDSMSVCPAAVIPVSAKEGDNVIRQSGNMNGLPTLLSALESLTEVGDPSELSTRFVVQGVYKGMAQGRVLSGFVTVPGVLSIQPGGTKTTVLSIHDGTRSLACATAAKSVSLGLSVLVQRGKLLTSACPAVVTDEITAVLLWLNEEPSNHREYGLRHLTSETMCSLNIDKRIDIVTLAESDSEAIGKNDLARVTISTRDPVVADSYNDLPQTGRFVLTDSGLICAAGIIGDQGIL